MVAALDPIRVLLPLKLVADPKNCHSWAAQDAARFVIDLHDDRPRIEALLDRMVEVAKDQGWPSNEYDIREARADVLAAIYGAPETPDADGHKG